MAKKLTKLDLLKLPSIDIASDDFIAFAAKSDGLYQKIGDEESKIATTKELLAKVKTDVPANAKFTDTVYTHPTNHPADIITQTASARFVTDTEKDNWNAKETTEGATSKANQALEDAKAYTNDEVVIISNRLTEIDETASSSLNDLNSRLKTDVPVDAVFTDTVYTHPETHPASIILQNSSNRFVSDAEKLAWNDKVDNSRVLTDVPANAKFTDTVYTHPTSHPYSMITGAPASLPANGGDSATVNGKTVEANVPAGAKFTDTIVDISGKADKSQVLTNVPANAKFTDTTYEEITEAEINTGTASTLRTITARRVTFILSKVSTLISNAISALTKNDVGLGNLDNIQQATKEEFNTHDADGTRHITAGERSAWGAKWDYNESTIKDVKVNNAANADTVNGKTVAENVPAGAKFTDTVYSHPNHTGDVTSTGDGATVIGNDKVTNAKLANMPTTTIKGNNTGATADPKDLTPSEVRAILNVADGANNYSHPTSDGNLHVPATGTTNNGKVLKAGATDGSLVWGTDNDTITTINGKTGAITKADIVALGIPAQDTVVDISGKADKTYVDNKVKTDVPTGAKFTDTVVSVSHLLPKSGGTLENYVEKLTTTTGAINLNSGNVFHRDATANTTFSITNAKAGAHSFTLIITMGATARTLTFPASVKWQDGEVPEMTDANKTYILTFMTINSGTTWFGMEGGSF